MAEVIVTAGRARDIPPKVDTRREAIRAVRAIIRDPKSSDAEVEDALETLVELSKE